jgi:hypothetical protein
MVTSSSSRGATTLGGFWPASCMVTDLEITQHSAIIVFVELLYHDSRKNIFDRLPHHGDES